MKNSFEGITEKLLDLIIEFWKELKMEEEYDRSDWIRVRLREIGIQINEDAMNYRLITPLDEKPEILFQEEMERFSKAATESLSVFIKRRKDWVTWMNRNQNAISACNGFKYRSGIHYFFIYKIQIGNFNDGRKKSKPMYKFVYQQKSSENHKDFSSTTPFIYPESWDLGILNVWEDHFPKIVERIESYMEFRREKRKNIDRNIVSDFV